MVLCYGIEATQVDIIRCGVAGVEDASEARTHNNRGPLGRLSHLFSSIYADPETAAAAMSGEDKLSINPGIRTWSGCMNMDLTALD